MSAPLSPSPSGGGLGWEHLGVGTCAPVERGGRPHLNPPPEGEGSRP